MPPFATQSDTAQPEVFGERLVGGVVAAEKQPDGTVRVRGLPFFAEIRADDPAVKIGLREPRDRAWLETALKKHQARRVLGQKPALNLRHLFDDPERVGEYELTHCAAAVVNPDEEPRFTLFGDKVYESVEAFEKSKDHDFRSAEISPDSPQELSAVALLRSKMPCHRFPNVKERLAPQLVEAFEAWSGKGWTAPQVWRGGHETFSAAETCAAGTKEPTKTARFDDAVSAIERGNHETKEEGHMPPTETKTETKAPSIDEKMEAMAAAFMEKLSKHFESLMKDKYAGAGEEKPDEKTETSETAKEDVKKAGGTEEPKAPPKKPETEAHQASIGPDALPAVSEAARGETFAAQAEKQGVGLLSVQEKLELLGLRQFVQKKQKEEQVESFAAAGEAALVSGGFSPDADVSAMLRESAKKDGKPGVDGIVSGILHYAKNAARSPEAFGALAGSGPAPSSPFDADVKKAVEVFGALPDKKRRILEVASQFRSELGELGVRSVAAGEFFGACEGDSSINPNAGNVEYWRARARKGN